MMKDWGLCMVGVGGVASSLKIVDDFIATRCETIIRQPDCDF